MRSLPSREKSDPDSSKKHIHSAVFAELISFITDMKAEESESPVFKLKDLCTLYSDRLRVLGVDDDCVHSTRLKDKICKSIPQLQAFNQGKNVLLAFKSDIGQALADVCEDHSDEDALCLAKASRLIRQELFDGQKDFNGSFDAGCEEQSVPASLLTLVRLIIEGPSINHQADAMSKHPALSIAQLIKFNSVKHRRESSMTLKRHRTCMETPLPIYIGAMVYAKTRKKSVVNKLFDLGLSISYDRVLKLTNEISSSVCNFYELQDVVCPPQLHRGLFTTAAVDNIDHNPSSNTSTDSFHGTAISLFQHPTNLIVTTPIAQIRLPETSGSTANSAKPQLPMWYSNVPPFLLITCVHH